MGVIASKPPHVLQKEEYEKQVTRDKMFIDIGTTSKEETEKRGVRIGDPVVPWSPFQRIMDGRVLMGKAFDDRIGAFITMYTLKKLKEKNVPHPNTVYGAATV
jgi:endoglucanase